MLKTRKFWLRSLILVLGLSSVDLLAASAGSSSGGAHRSSMRNSLTQKKNAAKRALNRVKKAAKKVDRAKVKSIAAQIFKGVGQGALEKAGYQAGKKDKKPEAAQADKKPESTPDVSSRSTVATNARVKTVTVHEIRERQRNRRHSI